VGLAATGTGPKGEFDTGEAAPATYTDRTVNMNKTAQEILDAKDPPIRMMWNACKNVFSQDFDKNKMIKAFTNPNLEMVVTPEHFMNQTCEYSDIVLPVTISYEDWDVTVSYWQYWININQQAIKPVGEAKSDITIAMELSAKLNSLEPGSCTFPTHFKGKEWMQKEFNDGIHQLFGIRDYGDLIYQGSKKAKMNPTIWADKKFKTPSGKFEFVSETAKNNGFHDICRWVEPRKPYGGKYQLLTPHPQWGIHSQFQNVDWTMSLNPSPFLYMNKADAKAEGLKDGDMVKVSNKSGEVKVRVRATATMPPKTILLYEAWFKGNEYNVQNLVDDESSDMGKMKTGAPGVAIHDQWADVKKI
jgi:anaerobic selenocysteine-containing dehydrogenase